MLGTGEEEVPPWRAAESRCPDLCPAQSHRRNLMTLGSLTGHEEVLGRVPDDLAGDTIAGASEQSPGLGAM